MPSPIRLDKAGVGVKRNATQVNEWSIGEYMPFSGVD